MRDIKYMCPLESVRDIFSVVKAQSIAFIYILIYGSNMDLLLYFLVKPLAYFHIILEKD